MTATTHSLPVLVWPKTDGPTLAAAAARVDDWPGLIEQAWQEGLAGLLAKRLTAARPEAVPPDAMKELERVGLIEGQRALYMTGHLLRVLTLFDDHGIEALPIKGPVFGQDVYGDPKVRHFYDLDVVVRFDDAARARRLLLDNGFADESAHNERVFVEGRREYGEVPLRHRSGQPVVDLQWQITVGLSRRALDADHLVHGARTTRVLDRTVRAPGLVDQLLLSLVHGSRHQWQPLELRLGVAVQVERLPAAAWPAICAAAGDLGCLRRTAAGVVYACAPFGVEPPAEIRAILESDGVTRRYLRHLRRGRPFGPAKPRDPGGLARAHLRRLWWQIRGEDTLVRAAGHLLTRGLRPGPEDWDAVRLPERLRWLHWALRPFRLVAKYALPRSADRARGAGRD